MTSKSYLPYLNYAEAVVTLTCQIISISLMSHLVYCALYNKKKLSVQHFPTSMVIYLLTNIVLSSLAMPYQLYITIKGKPGELF
uniref:Serpentine receptor class gamma n=1 Tax=Ditylenchus dipsaci TaxID=166011 RepID=A0A915DNQ7_9BILA